MKFVAFFRHRTTFNSEEDYFLSLLFKSTEFIERMSHTNLKINKNEFIENCDEYEKKEILKNIKNLKSKLFIKKINLEVDEQNLVNLLNGSNLEDNRNSGSNGYIGSESSYKSNGPILENINDGILNLDTERLQNEYCLNNFVENSLARYENMYNDFKIVLKIVESLKSEYKNEIPNSTFNSINDTTSSLKQKESAQSSVGTSSINNLIDF